MQVLGKSLEGTHGLWIAINRNRHIDAGCTDVDSGGMLPRDGLGMNQRHRRLALFGHTHDSKEGNRSAGAARLCSERQSSKRDRWNSVTNGLRAEPGAMLLNGFNRAPFVGRLIACRPDDLLHPIKDPRTRR
jgi:hypothetical protein